MLNRKWDEEKAIEAILERESKGLELSDVAVRKDDYALNDAANNILGT
jgi:hypothetical protein